MKKYLVGAVSGTMTRSCTVDMPNNYDPMSDSPDIVYSFPKLRKAVAERMKKLCTSSWEYDQWAADRTFVIAVSYLGEVKEQTVDNPTQLRNRVKDLLYKLGETGVEADYVIKYLPDEAKEMSTEELVMLICETINTIPAK